MLKELVLENSKFSGLDMLYFESKFPYLEAYAELLSKWGKKMNLVADTSLKSIYKDHVIDALTVAILIKDIIPSYSKIVDIGSGAGLPGVVLGICFNDVQTLLIEPRQKRVHFLKEAIRGFDNISAECSRFEQKHVFKNTFYITRATGLENHISKLLDPTSTLASMNSKHGKEYKLFDKTHFLNFDF